MKHATITNNTVAAVTGTHYTDANGVQHDLRAIRGWSREDKAAVGLYEVERQPVPEGHEATGWTLEPGEGVVLEVSTLREVTLDEQKATALAALAARRWQVETGGIDYLGHRIATDRESQSAIGNTRQLLAFAAEAGDPMTVDWKIADGDFLTLDLEQITAVALAVGGHVRACFAHEGAQAAHIKAAADAEALAAIDIEEGWPGD